MSNHPRRPPRWAATLDGPPPPAAPPRLAIYGARCTYWNDDESAFEQMRAAGQQPGQQPACPYCGGPCYQLDLDGFRDALLGDDDREAWEWQQGRPCHPTTSEMVHDYENGPT